RCYRAMRKLLFITGLALLLPTAALAKLPAVDKDGCTRLPGHHLRHRQCALLLRGWEWSMPRSVKHWQAFTLKGQRITLVGLHRDQSNGNREGSLVWIHKRDENLNHPSQTQYGKYREDPSTISHGIPLFRSITPYRPMIVLTYRGAACDPEGELA